ncbi:hypothetical protein SAMN02745115_00994 [[Eubacterium] yurii]|jgi:hypothetical protein|nr:hypothetical protein SAMN02745115_00994 [[Eubacterium] yurii]
MKNKFPIILLVLFTIFAIIKIAFTNSMIYMEKKDYTTFEQTIGELKYSLDNGELDSLKSKYMDILFQINSLNVKQAGDSGENNPETKNIYGNENLKAKLLDFNSNLNKYSEKYLVEQEIIKDEKTDENKEKTVEDAYLDSHEATKIIVFDKQKQQIQDEQMKMLKEILGAEDYAELEITIKSMNTQQKYLNAQVHQKILSILLKYQDLDAYLILGQLCGRFEIMAYYEPENGVIVKKELKGLRTPTITAAQEKKYKNLVNMQTLLLDVIYPKYFKGFFIFSDGEKGLLAYASDFQNNKRGYLGIDEKDFGAEISNDFEKTRFYHSVVNELSRVILLGNSQIDYTKGYTVSDIDDFETIKNLSKKDSYLLQFYSRFWNDIMYQDDKLSNSSDTKENANKYFFLRHKSQFLSEYVSQDPFRDIIESMTRFLLEKKPTENQIKYDKIRFFYEFSEIFDIAQRIQLNIKNLEGMK